MHTIKTVTFRDPMLGHTRRVKEVRFDDYSDLAMPREVGRNRREEVKQNKFSGRGTGAGGTGFAMKDEDENGATGEYIAHLVTGREWTGRDDPDARDLEGAEVKTLLKNQGRLRCYKKEKDDIPYILVAPWTNNKLLWIVEGWLLAGEIKELGSYEDPNNVGIKAYFVEKCLLHDMDDLPKLVRAEGK